MRNTRSRLLAGATAAGLAALSLAHPSAANASNPTDSLSLPQGTLSVSSLSNATLPAPASFASGTDSGALNSGTWSDLTGLGLGWNGTIAVTQFVMQGTWQPTGSSHAIGGSGASGTYTGSSADDYLTATVASAVGTTSTTVNWTDREGSTTTNSTSSVVCTNGSACTLNNGVSITFSATTAYAAGDSYGVEVGVLSSGTLKLATGSASGPTAQGTTLGGGNLPAFVNSGTTVAYGSSGTALGSAQKFVSATAGTGIGSFTLAPGATITWDPNQTWSSTGTGQAAYIATAQYTISAGP